MSLCPIKVATAIAKAAASSGTLATLIQQIMAAAIARGVAALPTILAEVFAILETSFPSEAALIAELQTYLAGLLTPPAPTPAPVTP